MKTELRKIALAGMLLSVCAAGVSGGVTNAARPEQRAQNDVPKETAESRPTAKTEAVKLNKPVVMAKHTGAKAGSSASTSGAKPLTVEEKKAVSRCWKRLMGMVREVNHAHRAKK